MRPLRQLLCSLCLAFVCAQFSHAQVVAAEVAAANWVVGDSYTIDVTRAGVTEQFSGELVYADELWVSLKSTVPGRNIGAPTKPGSRTFKSVGIGQEITLRCVPADATKVVERRSAVAAPAEAGEVVTPVIGLTVAVQYVRSGAIKKAHGKVVRLDANEVALVQTLMEAEVRQIPLVGEIPLIGDWFSYKRARQYDVDVTLPLEDVLAISLPGPAKFAQTPSRATK